MFEKLKKNVKSVVTGLVALLIGTAGVAYYELAPANKATGSASHPTSISQALQAEEGTSVVVEYRPVRFKEFGKGTSLNGKAWDHSGPADQNVETVWAPKGIPGYDLAKTGQALKVTGVKQTYKGKPEIVASKLEPAGK